jgi:hypothetical protein
LRLFVAAHPGVAPGYSWVITKDTDPEVEKWRRVRLAVVAAELVAFVYAMYALYTLA